MPHYKVKMPNGKWRLWTTIADGWISEPLDKEPSNYYADDFENVRGTLVSHLLTSMAFHITDDDDLVDRFINANYDKFSDFDKCGECSVQCNDLCYECLFEYMLDKDA